MLSKLSFICILFLLETAMHILYFSIDTKFFNKFQVNADFADVLVDTAYVISIVKTAFILPIYLIYYFTIRTTQPMKIAIYHTIIFAILFILLNAMFPGNSIKNAFELVTPIFITFVAAVLMGYLKSNWLVK